MKNEMNELEAQIADLQEKKKKLTLMQGVGVEENQDGNVGLASAVTGQIDYEKQDQTARKKMLIRKMQGME